MAQKVAVVLEDDLSGGPAKETVRFAAVGAGYAIDLSAKNAAAFRKQPRPYLEHARRVTGGVERLWLAEMPPACPCCGRSHDIVDLVTGLECCRHRRARRQRWRHDDRAG